MTEKLRAHCGRWLVVLVVVGVLLVYGIFRMLFQQPGQGATVIDQHPKQLLR